MSAARPQRRPPSRRGGGARVSVGVALALAVVALLVGLVVGYAAHGDDTPAGLATQTREVPVVTVTVPSP